MMNINAICQIITISEGDIWDNDEHWGTSSNYSYSTLFKYATYHQNW